MEFLKFKKLKWVNLVKVQETQMGQISLRNMLL